MRRKTQLRLVASPLMSSKGENSYIRFSKRVRDSLELSNDVVLVGKGDLQLGLTSKKAYAEDIRRLAKMVMQGRLTEEQALAVGFVTRSTQARVSRRTGDSAWVTEGIGNITVGCDPEFGLVGDDGQLQRADSLLPNSEKAQFGADGPGAEVRPAPSTSHLDVVKNISHILRNAPEKASKYSWRGGATYIDKKRTYWFGGHVHLGRPALLPAAEAVPIYQRIAMALDSLVALPLVSFDTPNPNARRNGCNLGYGKAGVWEHSSAASIRTDYPEQDRFEYRVLSGLWLTHPSLARMVLGVSKGVAEAAYNALADRKFDPTWAIAPANQNGLLKALGVKSHAQTAAVINRADPKQLNEDMIKNWAHQLRELSTYEDYAPEVEALIEIVQVSPEKVVPQLSLDIRRNWEDNPPVLPNAPAKLQKALEALS